MARHTPGPWRVSGRYVVAMKAKTVAELPQGGIIHGKVDTANAHLISAAPVLLHRLKIRTAVCPCPGSERNPELYCEDCTADLAAITQAEPHP